MANIDPADNQYTVNAAIADLPAGATLADVIAKVNAILAALRESDILPGR